MSQLTGKDNNYHLNPIGIEKVDSSRGSDQTKGNKKSANDVQYMFYDNNTTKQSVLTGTKQRHETG